MSWVSAIGQVGAPSDATTYETPADGLAVVTAANPPVAAMGFNVYMGLTPNTITLQNSAAVAVGASFTLPSTGLVTAWRQAAGRRRMFTWWAVPR